MNCFDAMRCLQESGVARRGKVHFRAISLVSSLEKDAIRGMWMCGAVQSESKWVRCGSSGGYRHQDEELRYSATLYSLVEVSY